MLFSSLLRNGQDLYLVVHTQLDPGTVDQSKFHVWKKFYKADVIFRKTGTIYYCQKIEEAEVLEYSKEPFVTNYPPENHES